MIDAEGLGRESLEVTVKAKKQRSKEGWLALPDASWLVRSSIVEQERWTQRPKQLKGLR